MSKHWWHNQTNPATNPATERARHTVHWFRTGERMHKTLSRLYRDLMNLGFTEGSKRWIR